MQRLFMVLGGARSGKSVFAEERAGALASACNLQKIYVATARTEWEGAPDSEFRARIEAHRARRGSDWRTIEAPDGLEDAVEAANGDGAVVLVDCLTLWLSNRLLDAEASRGKDVDGRIEALVETLGRLRGPTILVSNEVGLGLVPETALGRRFRDAQGRLNRLVAEQAELVVFVAAGLPLTLKGDLREWSEP